MSKKEVVEMYDPLEDDLRNVTRADIWEFLLLPLLPLISLCMGIGLVGGNVVWGASIFIGSFAMMWVVLKSVAGKCRSRS